jgi:hypothetical protein
MADKKISQLPSVSSVTNSDVFPVVATNATSQITLSNLAASMPNVPSASYADYANVAGTANSVSLVAGPGIIVNGLAITSSLRTVNGTFPTNGNVTISLTGVLTGTSASLIVSSSGTVTGSITNGTIWVVSQDPTPANNGDVYVFVSGSTGVWYSVAPLDTAAADARYIKLDGANSPLTGNLNIGGYNLTNIALINGITVGRGAGSIATNTAIGSQSLASNTTGNNNTANGYQALYSNTTGENNTANGYQALYSNPTGNNNTANGYLALYFNTTGENNTANGVQALYFNTTGENNTANGHSALYSNTTGSNNTATGFYALLSNTTGTNNTANGYQALRFNTTGQQNTANGMNALFSNTTGQYNTAIGYQAGYGTGTNANTTGNNNRFIGSGSVGVSATGSNRTWIGNSSTTSTFLAGNLLIGTTTDEGYRLNVSGSTNISGSVTITGSLNVTAGITGSFQGNGSGLTGLSTFPYTGSARITGSLILTGSLNIGNIGGNTSSLVNIALPSSSYSPNTTQALSFGSFVDDLNKIPDTGSLSIPIIPAGYQSYYIYANKSINGRTDVRLYSMTTNGFTVKSPIYSSIITIISKAGGNNPMFVNCGVTDIASAFVIGGTTQPSHSIASGSYATYLFDQVSTNWVVIATGSLP